jgi:hypothetical protein
LYENIAVWRELAGTLARFGVKKNIMMSLGYDAKIFGTEKKLPQT